MCEINEKEFNEMLEARRKNKLYRESKSILKDLQNRKFTENGVPINGEKIMGEFPEPVIIRFKDGFIHSENDEPAVEKPQHWEYWNEGNIVKVIDDNYQIMEYWENGIPQKIIQRAENDECN